ncbi:MAG: peptide chain release factor 1 [Lachnospiraceae bacterium]|nr:peptide chain release factor 1 [Lachnospiraceae bacterium]
MERRYEDVLKHFEEIMQELNTDIAAKDNDRYMKLMKEQSDLTPLVDAIQKLKKAEETEKDSLNIIDTEKDEELLSMAREDLATSKKDIEELEQQIKIMLIPKDPLDDRNIIIEIRQGAGGDEAALFAAEIYRMYQGYIASMGWSSKLLSVSEIGIGGFKEVIFMVNGVGAYSKFKYETGVHRVQRVPVTESGGRIHTSTITVAVMPEVEDVDIKINPADVEMEVYRSSGAGGQHVNKTSSAVRLIHKPTGIVVACQEERSQFQNKDKAMAMLRAKLYDMEQEKQHSQYASEKRSQIGTGDRSEKIRTYNFPQGRVTDHRIGLSLYNIDEIMNGDINELIETIIAEDRARKLAMMQN